MRDAIFEISTLENLVSTKFHRNRTTLVFGHFLGDLPPENMFFFAEKNVRTKILMFSLDSVPSKGTKNRFTAKSDHN